MNRIAVLSLVLLCSSAAAAQPIGAPKPPKRWVIGAWKGVYHYAQDLTDRAGRRLESNFFELFFIQKKDSLEGHIAEPNTFGAEGAPHLVAGLRGTISGSAVEFIKLYDGTADVAHAVRYKGTLSHDGRAIKGDWTIQAPEGGQSTSGTFEMEAVGDL